MRRAAKVDRNQAEIVEFFRGMGCSVAHTHMIGQGFPDIIVGWQGRNFLIEIKDLNQPPSKRKLTLAEQEWHEAWRGQVCTLTSVTDAIEALRQWRLI